MKYTQPTPSLRRPSRILAKSLVVCLFLFTTHSVLCEVLAADLTGSVVRVLDGDTIEVLHSNRAERIRLSGIDCPEKGRAYGNNAKQAASALVFGKEVTLQTYGHDKYGRTLADVLLLNGTNVNHTLVKEGWCWWYRKYAPGDRVLAKAPPLSPATLPELQPSCTKEQSSI